MNQCEIGLFYVVWGVSKGTVIIIMRFGKNTIMSKIHQYIWILGVLWYEFWGGTGT